MILRVLTSSFKMRKAGRINIFNKNWRKPYYIKIVDQLYIPNIVLHTPKILIVLLKIFNEIHNLLTETCFKTNTHELNSSHITKISQFSVKSKRIGKTKNNHEHFASSTWCRQRNITFLKHVFSTLPQHRVYFDAPNTSFIYFWVHS